ncbi:RTA-like protein, partial [Coemansia mojavensis]
LDYFTYIPVHGAPEAAAVVFAALAVILVVQSINTMAARWVYILVGTAIAESLGYVFRAICIDHASLGLFICMNLFLLLPPNALALFNYKAIGEVVRKSGIRSHRFWLRPRFIVWFYFASDIFSFLLQSTGASMTAQEDTADTGKWICIGGLAIQLAFLTSFSGIIIAVMRNPLYTVDKSPRDEDSRSAKRRVMMIMVVTTALLYVRSVYRLIEFIDGYGGKIYSAEWAFWVFDTVAILGMFLVYILFVIVAYFPR